MYLITFLVCLTIVTIFCWYTILINKRKHALTGRHYRLLKKTGVISYFTQLIIVFYLWYNNDFGVLPAVVTVCAFVCFCLLLLQRIRNVWKPSSRDLTQAMLWGQAVFPLVLFSTLGVDLVIDRILN